jgi:ribonuclease HII
MFLLGIDDAGRGPLIGPMILAGVLIENDQEKELKKLGAKDSKLLTHPERVRIAELIEKQVISHYIVKASPAEIDSAVLGNENLNTLEARKMAEVINALNDKKKKIKVIVDCPSINTVKWREKLLSFIAHTENLDVVCEHKADFNHPVVSAASILAKVTREIEVDKIKREYGDIGSGYPSDPFTKAFLRENGSRLSDSGIFRKSWATWTEMFPSEEKKSRKQKSLLEY